MDVHIIYEHVERELYNAFLIKFELEKRGYDVLISSSDQIRFSFAAPKLIIMPWLFGDHNLDFLRKQYFNKFYKILNLQYEQVTSDLWLDIGYHVPKDKARNANILCWGENRKQILVDNGISSDNIKIIGDIRQDFTKSEFRGFFKTKKQLSEEFNIPYSHNWNLFVSSFSFTNQDDESKIYFENLMGLDNYEYWRNCNIESQKIILNWIKRFLDENPNHEFIYRPHPSEIKENDWTMLKKLDDDYSNFHFIFKYSVQDWILNSDFINFWFSTSIVECFSLNKPCNILRPVKIDEYYDVPFYINAEQITDYNSFKEKNLFKNKIVFPINVNEIKRYYDNIDDDEFVYKKLCDYIEEIINDDSYKQNFYNENFIIEELKFFIEKIREMRVLKLILNLINDKKNNNVKSTMSNDYEKFKTLKKIVEDNFD